MTWFLLMEGTGMNKAFEGFIAVRCNEALMQSEEYLKMEQDEEVEPEELQALAEEICYMRGLRDMMSFMLNDTQ